MPDKYEGGSVMKISPTKISEVLVLEPDVYARMSAVTSWRHSVHLISMSMASN